MSIDISELRSRLKSILESDVLMAEILPLAGDINRAKFSRGRLLSKIAADNEIDLAQAVEAAMGLEMVHMASLIHDDVIDDADLRRSSKSFKASRGNKGAILYGDYLFSAAIRQIQRTQDGPVASLFTQCVYDTCRGEAIQDLILNEQNDITIDLVLEAAKGKTGALFSFCTGAPALMKGYDQEFVKNMSRIGLLSGLAFQIADDILDICGEEKDLGKPHGNDLVKNTMTSPLFYFMSELGLNWKEFRSKFMENTIALKHEFLESESFQKVQNQVAEIHDQVQELVNLASENRFLISESIELFWQGFIYKRMSSFQDLKV